MIAAAIASAVTWLLAYLQSLPWAAQFLLALVAFGVLLVIGVVVARYWRDGRLQMARSQGDLGENPIEKSDEPGTVDRIRSQLLELAKEIPVKEVARETVWHFSFRDWEAEIAGFLHASLSVVAARDFMKAVESDCNKWAARKYIEGLAARLDGRVLREHQRITFKEAKVEPARVYIASLAESVPLQAAQQFIGGVAEYKSDWKKETYRGLSAIVEPGLAREYSNILRSDEPNKQAHKFLKALSQTLRYDQLRGPSD